MPYELPLPFWAQAQGWKVKIRDKERLEPPHATVLRRAESWRWNLRTRSFMDRRPPPREVPKPVVDSLMEQHATLCGQWDRMYPENPVAGESDDD